MSCCYYRRLPYRPVLPPACWPTVDHIAVTSTRRLEKWMAPLEASCCLLDWLPSCRRSIKLKLWSVLSSSAQPSPCLARRRDDQRVRLMALGRVTRATARMPVAGARCQGRKFGHQGRPLHRGETKAIKD
ncbi:hypothetical protein BKA81DRAFT_160145 [Phyllosticta paracitricarpa]